MDMKRNYYEDVQLFSSGVVVFWFAALLIFLALFPFLFKNYYVYVANYIAIMVIVSIGLNLLVGYTGQLSIGHAGFFAIGAYGTIVLMSAAHFPFLLALPVAALVAAFFGFLLGESCGGSRNQDLIDIVQMSAKLDVVQLRCLCISIFINFLIMEEEKKVISLLHGQTMGLCMLILKILYTTGI